MLPGFLPLAWAWKSTTIEASLVRLYNVANALKTLMLHFFSKTHPTTLQLAGLIVFQRLESRRLTQSALNPIFKS
ncbi:hypothetical protein L218DRAFT_220416 [Marasmius fiardii PR-910]|nr:hypothetical protein L218DRAFT_220416 [Marasmius fiardii PR-910]